MPFRPDLLKGLRDAKGLSQQQLGKLADLSHSAIAKNENGRTSPGSEVLDKLARALDCTIDYLHGRGYEYLGVELAAAHMAFDIFVAQQVLPDELREKCRRALNHREAPKTVQGWRSFSEMLLLATAPTSSICPISLEDSNRPKSKPMAIARRRHH